MPDFELLNINRPAEPRPVAPPGDEAGHNHGRRPRLDPHVHGAAPDAIENYEGQLAAAVAEADLLQEAVAVGKFCSS